MVVQKNESEQQQNAVKNVPQKVFTLEILLLVKDAQQQHGLRHGDYQRYRSYCTRRIRRLRKALKFPQGDKRHFKRRDVTLLQLTGKKADDRYIHIPLVSAERAWSYAMQLKQESNTEARKRFHLISKLRKACTFSLQLQELCNSNAFDARTKLECEAYVAWLHGTLHFELQIWKTAGEHLKRAQVIYESLAKALPEDERELYYAKVNEFTPNLRYCAYNLGGSGSAANMDSLLGLHSHALVENLDALLSQTKTESSEGLHTIEWRGRKVTVRPEKVRIFLLSAQDLDKSIEQAVTTEKKIELLERMLLDCKDAINAVRDEIKQDPKLRSITTGQTVPGIQYLIAHLSYIRYSRTVQRNLCLVGQTKSHFEDPNQKNVVVNEGGKRIRAQDLARLYEILLQNVHEMEQIAGLEADADYQSEVNTLSLAFKAFRCYYIALALIDMKKWKEAVALYERATKYAKNALSGRTAEEFDLRSELEKLIATINGCKHSAHANTLLEAAPTTSVTVKSHKSSKPLYERLNQYKEDQSLNSKTPNVFKMTPDMIAIACKPLFYDLALNHVELPSLEEKLNSPKKPASSTLTGFVKGFLGWGGGN